MKSLATTIRESEKIREEAARNGAEFLFTELETSNTFLNVARTSRNDPAKFKRNLANARKGYDTLVRISAKLPLDAEDQQRFMKQLEKLRADLEQEGEKFQA